MPFLGHEELRAIRELRKQGKLDLAEKKLLSASPMSPAVLDELRKIASTRAKEAKKRGDWGAVVDHLERYMDLAKQHRRECIQLCNQAPPNHTPADSRLLAGAREKACKEQPW